MFFRRAFPIAAAALVIAVLAAASWTVYAIHTVAPRAGVADVISLLRNEDPAQDQLGRKLKSNQRVNLLFLAHGGAGNDNPNYTDTMLLLSVVSSTRRATVFSLPRYLWVDIPAPARGKVQAKLYSAFAIGRSTDPSFLNEQWRTPTGPGDLAAATVSATLAQPVDGWIAVDIPAFQALIDSMGGVQVTVPEALDDPTYPSDVDEETVHIHFDPGLQRLNGKRALEYVRSRLSTSEADRSRRQEIVLFAVLKQLETAGIGPAMIPAARALQTGLRTNLTMREIQDLRGLVGAIRERDIRSITLEDSPLLMKETIGTDLDVLVPRAGGYGELQAYVAGQLP